ncbi:MULTISPECIES: hypothetical protein [Pseudorhizobium]|uniref:hypothetical protein n=1 Tax=Pseudorhizobium TaxID=1903858 RepID=UPI00068A3E90|nr:hypothetical protein [Pseudorhizobium marinum]MDY6963140.1 hypothetical protein [Pseudomonadota bacterium]|tara:strand:- start:5859 stop:6296 length:438 start_codon:yes stop_codon:yes gene_type:complete
MTTIGSLNLQSYALPYRPDAASPSSEQAVAPSSASGAALISGDAAASKLSAALWDLAVLKDTSAQDEEVWVGSDSSGSAAEQEFSKLADMDFGEMVRAKYLEDHDLTEADLRKMAVEEREMIEAEIRAAILKAMGITAPEKAEAS